MIPRPYRLARELVSYLEDCDCSVEEFEFLQKYSKGPLLEAVENQLVKMDEKAEELRQEQAIEKAEAAYEWHMECKGDQMREDGKENP